MEEWPEWWSWTFEMSPHVLRRMVVRQFTEAELRAMIEDANGYRADYAPGRWVLKTTFRGSPWEVIVEPDEADQVTVVVTAYEVK